MRQVPAALAVLSALLSLAGCGPGASPGGHPSVISGTYQASNAAVQQDGCDVWGVPPTAWTSLNGTTATVTVGASNIMFQGSGQPSPQTLVQTGNVWDAHYDTQYDWSTHTPPYSCVTRDIEDDVIEVTGNNQFAYTVTLGATMVSGSACNAIGVALPCTSNASVQYAKK